MLPIEQKNHSMELFPCNTAMMPFSVEHHMAWLLVCRSHRKARPSLICAWWSMQVWPALHKVHQAQRGGQTRQHRPVSSPEPVALLRCHGGDKGRQSRLPQPLPLPRLPQPLQTPAASIRQVPPKTPCRSLLDCTCSPKLRVQGWCSTERGSGGCVCEAGGGGLGGTPPEGLSL